MVRFPIVNAKLHLQKSGPFVVEGEHRSPIDYNFL